LGVFSNLYKNSNKGVKGRGKNRKVDSSTVSLSPMVVLCLGDTRRNIGNAPAYSSMLAGHPSRTLPHSPLRGVALPKIKSEFDEDDENQGTILDEETESDGYESETSVYYELSAQGLKQSSDHISDSVLSPIKQAMIDRLMEQFWEMFHQEWSSNLTQCGGSRNSTTGSRGGGMSSGQSNGEKTNDQGQKRKRQDDDDDHSSGNSGNNGLPSKQPLDQFKSSNVPSRKIKLACPYRKHNRRVYCVDNYQSCVLSHWESVGRVK
jgi:hypothetical protein